ncbi:MAG: aa3-type cytochrome c oxidase subunit IV [Novosphingobium sp.]
MRGRKEGDREAGETAIHRQGLLPMASGNDQKAHESTYTGFIGLVKFTMVAVALIAAFVIFMITK